MSNRDDHDHARSHDNRIELIVVVGSQEYPVTVNLHSPLQIVRNEALAEAKATGQPPDRWDLKLPDGTPLDVSRPVETFGFAPGTKLYCSQKIGVGG